MKKYKSNRKGSIRYLLIGAIALPIIFFVLDTKSIMENPLMLLPLLVPLALISWIYFETFYTIDNNELIYRSAFIRGRIDISTIKEIQKGKTMWSGIKPALARHGLIVKFNAYDVVYISPVSNDELIADLLKVNPDIEITE